MAGHGVIPQDGAVRLSVARFSSRLERDGWLTWALALLSGPELDRLAAAQDPGARTQQAVGRALLRVVAARSGAGPPQAVTVAEAEGGKPWLPEVPGLHVNVSHTAGAVVLAVSSAGPIGVDMELPGVRAEEALAIAERCFAPAEAETLRALDGELRAEAFCRMWTIKEAVGKALGLGVFSMLGRVVVAGGGPGGGLALSAVDGGPPAASWTVHQLTAPGGSERITVALPVPGVCLSPVEVLRPEPLAATQGATART